MASRYGYLGIAGWHGVTRTRVEIVGETPHRLRIRALEPTRLAGRYRVLQPGQSALVPRYAVVIEEGREA